MHATAWNTNRMQEEFLKKDAIRKSDSVAENRLKKVVSEDLNCIY